jgi:hypothetical protein
VTKKPSAKRKRITLALLGKHHACTGGVDWFKAQKKTELRDVVTALIDDGRRANWANWLTGTRLMTLRQKRQYAIFAAEQVIDIFEKKYPNDKRPREAIEAAKRVLKSPTAANKEKARAAADAAAADAAYAAAAAAAADAAYAAANCCCCCLCCLCCCCCCCSQTNAAHDSGLRRQACVWEASTDQMSDIEARARAYAEDYSGFTNLEIKKAYLAGARAECAHLSAELARVKQECAEPRLGRDTLKEINVKFIENSETIKQQAKEAGALSMATMIDDSGRAAYDGPTVWMAEWRKREAKQDE